MLDQGTAYLKLRRLLFGALARLARTGFTVPPADGLDLIQDFFAERWTAVSKNFDPTRGTKLETYVYQAFVRFARPRIAQLHRWRNLLVDAAYLATIPDTSDDALTRSEAEEAVLAVQGAIAGLPELQRDVVVAYFSAERASERAIAEKFPMSRYRLRKTLVEAFAGIAVAIGKRGGISEDDWRVAQAIWSERRTLAETADALGLTLEQVRRARERIGTILVRQLRTSPDIRRREKGGSS